MEKKIYAEPELEVIEFVTEDVIATSDVNTTVTEEADVIN